MRHSKAEKAKLTSVSLLSPQRGSANTGLPGWDRRTDEGSRFYVGGFYKHFKSALRLSGRSARLCR